MDKQAAGTFDDLVGRLLTRIAPAGPQPAWKQTPFFRRYAAN
jgi:hypothetical protein